ncbi:hypothetical protein [Pedobacter sp. HMWF019]|uniref:hypothetical protein n=1 Tax=Pedobacter sp. HMWF019 TaxID=2056856 RepID=UPI0013048640|nr:hypothetical protein [Pedobacter sp. HMWF019]
MKQLKKILRLTGLGILIILASFGIGLGGPPPVLQKTREKDRMEWAENKEEKENPD